MDLQNLQPSRLAWRIDRDFPVKAARPTECRIDTVGKIARRNNHDLSSGRHTIHQCEKLRYDPLLNISQYGFAVGSEGIDLIKEDDRTGMLLRLRKDLPQQFFRLAVMLLYDLRTVY